MTNQHFNYTIEPLKSFIFTLSEESGHWNTFSAYPQETKGLSVKDKIKNYDLQFEFLHRNTTCCLVFLHCRLNKISINRWVTLFQQNSFRIRDS